MAWVLLCSGYPSPGCQGYIIHKAIVITTKPLHFYCPYFYRQPVPIFRPWELLILIFGAFPENTIAI